MRYEILIYNNAECEAAIRGGLRDELDRTHAAVLAELEASGELVASDELSTEVAVVVRTDEGAPHHVRRTDGPYSESKEWVGGFYVVDCETLDRAVEIAGRFIEARWSPVEVRQFVHFTG